MTLTHHAKFLANFRCIGDQCEDTCCKSWSMQVDSATLERYRSEAPELIASVDVDNPLGAVMCRDPQTDFCVKFEKGWCGIHKKYGDDFLGDACHFFPRVSRLLKSEAHQTASLACPEAVRCMLQTPDAFSLNAGETSRLPHAVKSYDCAELSEASMLATHATFLAAADNADTTAERSLCRIMIASEALERIEKSSWPDAAAFYLKTADSRLQPAEPNPGDLFLALHALIGLIDATQKSPRPRLEQVIADICSALQLTLPENPKHPFTVVQDHFDRVTAMQELWKQHESALQPWLKRWLQAQLSLAFFPFSGFGNTLPERAAIIGIRLATLKLALMAELQLRNTLAEADFVRITQSLARFLDHLADPTLSLRIYSEPGWLKLGRLRALLGDN